MTESHLPRDSGDVSETTPLLNGDNPWPGLSPFDEGASAFFFGRETETAELDSFIRRDTLTVVYGQSGLGKTSLLRAGLAPRLRQADFLPVYLRLDHAETAPDLVQQIKDALTRALAAAQADARPPKASETLWEYFHAAELDFWSPRNQRLAPVLILDQFEELFTVGRHTSVQRARAQTFLAELACVVTGRAPETVQSRLDAAPETAAAFDFEKKAVKVLLSLREDFLPEFESLRELCRWNAQNRFRLRRMNGKQAWDVVAKPGARLVDDAVTARIVDFVSSSRKQREKVVQSRAELSEREVEPALLSVVCRELNNRRLKLGQTAITADLLSGSKDEIIDDFYTQALAEQDPAVRRFLEDELLTGGGFRKRAALEDALKVPGVTFEAIQALVSRRLLRQEDSGGVVWIEFTHDLLTDVAQASRSERQNREAIAAAAAREKEAKEKLLATRRRSRRVIVAFSAGLAAALVCAGISFAFYRQAVRARDRATASEARVREIAASLRQESLHNRDAELGNAQALSFACDRLIKLTKGKEQASWHAEKAYALSILGDHEGAIQEATLAVQMNPENLSFLESRIYYHLQAGHPEKCIADADAVLASMPKNFISRLNRHVALGQVARYDEAIADCLLAIQCLQVDATSSFYQEEVSPDIGAATRRRRLDTDTYQMRTALCYGLVGMRLYAGETNFEAALTAADKQPASMHAFLYANNWAWLQMKLRPQDYGAWVQQALLWHRAGFLDYEQSCLVRFLQEHQRRSDPRYQGLAHWVSQRDPGLPALAAKDSGASQAEAPSIPLLVLEAKEFRAAGKLDAAQARISQAVSLEPSNLLHRLLRADIRKELMDYQGVIEDCDIVLNTETNNSRALLLRGLAGLYLNGRTDARASQDFKNVVLQDPNNFSALYFYAVTIKDTQPAEALKLLRRCQGIDDTITNINNLVKELEDRAK